MPKADDFASRSTGRRRCDEGMLKSTTGQQDSGCLRIGTHAVQYAIRRSSRARAMSLRISAGRGLELVLPSTTPLADGLEFMRRKSGWIARHRERLIRVERIAAGRERLPDATLYRGRSYPVHLRNSSTARVELTTTHMRVLARDHTAARAAVRNWFEHRARLMIPQRVRELAAAHHVADGVRRICVRDQRTRWGSCSAKGTLSFNWRLIMMPPDIMDYVIVHELAHLQHPHHRRGFWRAVEEMLPDYRRGRHWLKTAGDNVRFFWD